MKHDCGAGIEPGMTMCACGELLVWAGDVLEVPQHTVGVPPTVHMLDLPMSRASVVETNRASLPAADVMCDFCERVVPSGAVECDFCQTPVPDRSAVVTPRIHALAITLPGGVRFELGSGPLTLGRMSEDERVGSALDRDEVSRRHATLRVREGAVWLRDLDSMNGTWLAGRKVTGEVRLPSGDVIVGLGRAVTVTVHVPPIFEPVDREPGRDGEVAG